MKFLKQRHHYLLEGFKSSDLEDAKEIISDFLSKKIGELYPYGDKILIKQGSVELEGMLFLSLDNKGVRFNWKKGDERNSIHSISLWKNLQLQNNEDMFSDPDAQIELGGNSVVSALQKIVKFFNGSVNELIDDNSNNVNSEKATVGSISDLDPDEARDIDMDVFDTIKYFVWQVAYGKSNSLVITGQPGVGKCHTKGTKLRMYNGCIKNVEDIQPDELLMGDDSLPRKILSTTKGKDKLYEIIPVSSGFDKFGCNSDHILSLRRSNNLNEIVNISIKEYLNWSDSKKRLYKLYRKPIEYSYKEVDLDPYFLGLWLGDGNTHNATIETMDENIIDYIYDYAYELNLNISISENKKSKSDGYKITNGKRGYSKDNFVINQLNDLTVLKNKHIPDLYLYNTFEIRKKLLSGLIDSDGYQFHKTYEISTKLKNLATQIKYLCNSLGYSAWIKEKIINEKPYYLVRINGDLSDLPILLERKQSEPREQIKNIHHTGFKIKEIGHGDYYGFTIDGNHLYCLHDYVVTHNTYDVTQALSHTPRANDYVDISGTITTSGLYEELFTNNGKLLVFDDTDSVFDSEGSRNMLKAALDTYPERKISKKQTNYFPTEGLTQNDIRANHTGDMSLADHPTKVNKKYLGKFPKDFLYTGQIIFISNLKGEEIDSAVISRSLHVDVNLTKEEVMTRMRKVMEKTHPEISMELKEEALRTLDYITTHFDTKFALSIRSLVHAINLRMHNSGVHNVNGKPYRVWELLLKRYLMKGKEV